MSDTELNPQIAVVADNIALPKKCGIIMPISGSEDYTEQHWADVMDIIKEALNEVGFETDLVSNSQDSGVIHKRIVENLYENPIIICDVSSRNPNVMFELGLRLAFDKPTIIIKDDATPFSFDTSIIEHISYPRDLRHNLIQDFQKILRRKVKATHEVAKSNPEYSTFLKHFVNLKPGEVLSREIPNAESLISLLREDMSEGLKGILLQLHRVRNDVSVLKLQNKELLSTPVDNSKKTAQESSGESILQEALSVQAP